jgi:hypothetical protein
MPDGHEMDGCMHAAGGGSDRKLGSEIIREGSQTVSQSVMYFPERREDGKEGRYKLSPNSLQRA